MWEGLAEEQAWLLLHASAPVGRARSTWEGPVLPQGHELKVSVPTHLLIPVIPLCPGILNTRQQTQVKNHQGPY